jgi:hypothetical protein
MERRIVKGASARSATAKRKRTERPGRCHHGPENHAQIRRVADELNKRRAKPNPMGRPPVAESSALRALRAMLAKADGPEAIRIGHMIEQTEALYRPRIAPQMPASKPPAAPVNDTGKADLPRGATYHGQPCRHCGGTLRYVKGWTCVTCNRRKSTAYAAARRARQQAAASGDNTSA